MRKKDAADDLVRCAQISREINHPFIAPLLFFSQTADEIFLLSPLICGGHLFYYLQMEGHFELHQAKHYAAEILCALEYLHSLDTILDYYGCLHPSNIRLDTIGHVALCDFGLYMGKQEISTEEEEIQWTEYPSPELLLGLPRAKTTDWWTLGSILYEMLLGLPPFAAKDRRTIRLRILADEPLPSPEPNTLSAEAQDLLQKLLCRPEQRLGLNGTCEIKKHSFFHGVDWSRLARREYTPVFKPSDTGPTMDFPSKRAVKFKQKMRSQFLGWGRTEATTPRMGREQTPETALFENKITQNLKEAHAKGVTDGILRTQLLSLAVNRHDVLTVQRLLAEGVQPDFPHSVHPTAHHRRPSDNWSQDLVSPSERDGYLPPLARAVGWRDLALARKLLLAGADANVGFHHYSDPAAMSHGSEVDDCCGRVVQLAMKLEHEEMVDLLCEFGADVCLAQPVIKDHQCKDFDRRTWVHLRAGLMGRIEGSPCSQG